MMAEGTWAWLKWELQKQLLNDYNFKKNKALKFMRCLKYNRSVKGRQTLEKKAQKWIDKASAVLIKIEKLNNNERTKE